MGVLETGMVQLFYGHGRGKTSCAVGGAVRMLGNGGRVLMVQFLKAEGEEGGDWFRYGELRTLEKISRFKVVQMGQPSFITRGQKPTTANRKMAAVAMELARNEVAGGEWDMVILDEVTEAWNFKLVSVEDIIAVIEAKHPLTELVLTGRFAPDEIVERADLVTEFRHVKHPFESGVKARRGIEY